MRPAWELRTRLQILAVCFGGRALAAIFLYTLPPVVEAGSGEAASGTAAE